MGGERTPDRPDALVSFWIEFGDWPGELATQRIPPYPQESGVTAWDLDDALDLIHRGFYEAREPAPVAHVDRGVSVAPGWWAGADLPRPTGRRGIWYPRPFYPARTVEA